MPRRTHIEMIGSYEAYCRRREEQRIKRLRRLLADERHRQKRDPHATKAPVTDVAQDHDATTTEQ